MYGAFLGLIDKGVDMKQIVVKLVLGTLVHTSLFTQEQIPTFNVKNKCGRDITIVIGILAQVKKPVVMRFNNNKTDYFYTPGTQIELKNNASVSLYGLNIEEAQAIDCYFSVQDKQKKVHQYKLVAQFVGNYKTLYLKYVLQNNMIFIKPQEGKLFSKAADGYRFNETTDGYSLSNNIKEKQIKVQGFRDNKFVPLQKESMRQLEDVDMSEIKTVDMY
jgi:hypothetical protein